MKNSSAIRAGFLYGVILASGALLTFGIFLLQNAGRLVVDYDIAISNILLFVVCTVICCLAGARIGRATGKVGRAALGSSLAALIGMAVCGIAYVVWTYSIPISAFRVPSLDEVGIPYTLVDHRDNYTYYAVYNAVIVTVVAPVWGALLGALAGLFARRRQRTTMEPAPSPASLSQPYHGASYPSDAAYPGYAGTATQSMPMPLHAPSSGYQVDPQHQNQSPIPGSFPHDLPLNPYGQPPQGAVPLNSGYQGQASQKQQSHIIRQFIADSKLVMTRPSIASFDSIQSHANMATVFLEILVIGVAYAIAGSFLGPGGLFGGLIGTFFGTFISLSVGMLVAKAFGGVGNFRTYAYAMAVIDFPLGIADAASLLIPGIDALVFVLGIVYSVYVGRFACASVHRLTMGQSYLVYIIGLVIKLVILIVAFATITIFVLFLIFGHH